MGRLIEHIAEVSSRGAELCHGGKCSDRACDGEPGDGGRRLVSSEPVEKHGKNSQEGADHVGIARVVIVADRQGEVIEGSQRVAVFGREEAQVGRKV